MLPLLEKVLTPNTVGAVKEVVRLGRSTNAREIFILDNRRCDGRMDDSRYNVLECQCDVWTIGSGCVQVLVLLFAFRC